MPFPLPPVLKRLLVPVTVAQVEAARVIVRRNEESHRETPDSILAIANAPSLEGARNALVVPDQMEPSDRLELLTEARASAERMRGKLLEQATPENADKINSLYDSIDRSLTRAIESTRETPSESERDNNVPARS